ncbi:DNA gyrase subunit A [Brevibacterium oceani]|uniref:DNA gyrase subunit A n=1 Tax=Brevibacterium oceani TaxID=358099 RepID=UPI0015E7B74F|nr:DNA gyrase subunit A [Brevibacterium oceani]
MDGRNDEEQSLLEKISILEGYRAAIERRREVLDLLETAPNPESAADELSTILGINDLQANAILDLQLRRLDKSSREGIIAELEEGQRRLRLLRDSRQN